jgi:hypothetical protein
MPHGSQASTRGGVSSEAAVFQPQRVAEMASMRDVMSALSARNYKPKSGGTAHFEAQMLQESAG